MSKMLITLIILVVFGGIITFSCQNNENIANTNLPQEEVFKVLDSLQEIYAPDSRIDLWKFEFDKDSVNILNGMVYNEKAFEAVKEKITALFPAIELKLELLPADKNENLVDAIITNSVATIRTHPKHSAEIATQALMGTPVKILKDGDNWILVQLPNKYIGWAYSFELAKLTKEDFAVLKTSTKVIYSQQNGYSYKTADSEGEIVSDLTAGCILFLEDSISEYYKVKYPDQRLAFVKKTETISANEWLKREPIAEKLVQKAKLFMGLPYLWGGTSAKAIDCSGFTSSIYFMNGILLQRDASQQTLYGKDVAIDKKFSELEVGDLLFFGRQKNDSLDEKVSHVGMYIGDSEFIHASGRVRINSVDSTRENYSQYYIHSFVRARRIINQDEGKGIQRIEENEFYKTIF